MKRLGAISEQTMDLLFGRAIIHKSNTILCFELTAALKPVCAREEVVSCDICDRCESWDWPDLREECIAPDWAGHTRLR